MKELSFRIKAKIESYPSGYVFTYDELGDRSESTRKLTSRMVEQKKLVALKSGLFLKPKYNKFLKKNLSAGQGEVVQGLLRKGDSLLGDHSLFYSLGLTPQVPLRPTLLVNSDSSELKIEKEIIYLQKSPIPIQARNKEIVKILYLLRNIGKVFESRIEKQVSLIKKMIAELSETKMKTLVRTSVESDQEKYSALLGAFLEELSEGSENQDLISLLRKRVRRDRYKVGFSAGRYLAHATDWGLAE